MASLERSVLLHLAAVHAVNPRAEVPLIELERELGLDKDTALQALRSLVSQGYAEADLFPVNIWAKITDKGIALLEGGTE